MDDPSAGGTEAQNDGSCPRWVIVIVLPTANGPVSSTPVTPASHSGQRLTSAQASQMASRETAVSTLCSILHIPASLLSA